MDRIRKALDLARLERDGQSTPSRESGAAFESKVITRIPTAIEYTKTKIFNTPEEILEANRVIGPANPDAAAHAFRMLRTQILQRLEENRWNSLAILSPRRRDGKTMAAINLAISLASDQRHTVLLVDFDLRRPTIAARLGIRADMGAGDVLRGAARVEDCLYHPEGFDRLVVLPAREAIDDSSEALTGPRCRDIVTELRGRYPDRILIFDLPPVLDSDDALAFAPLVDCGLVVVAEGSTRREDLLRCMELLRKLPVVGTVLNRATEAASSPDR